MSDSFNLTLNVAQLFMLGGVVWGVARMSKSVEQLVEVTREHTTSLNGIGNKLASLVGRVGILEDRSHR